MELFIVRHGEAETGTASEEGPPLTERGRHDVEKVSRMVDTLEKAPLVLFSSPLIRAIQTADALNQDWDLSIQKVEWLTPGVEPSRILKELSQTAQEKIAIVGHLPTLGWLLSALVWGVPPKEIILPTGSVTFLEVSKWEPAGAKIRWMLSPDMFGSKK